MRRLPAWRPRHPIILAAGVVFAVLALATAGHHTAPSVRDRTGTPRTAVVLTAGGDPLQVEKAKTALKSAAIGYALAALAPLIVSILASVVGGS